MKMKNFASILLATLLMGAAALAHGNMQHILGTVVQITGDSISVKTSDGSIKIAHFDAETHFLKGASPATSKDVMIGSRVVIHAHAVGDKFHAAEVKIGATSLSQPKSGSTETK
jgi:hypothetical protein